MKAFMNWLSNSFAPKVRVITQKTWISAVSSTMQKIIPFILTGSVIYFYGVFRSYIPSLPNIGVIADFSFGMIGLITAFMMANQAMEKLKHPGYTLTAGLVSICVFMMFVKPTSEDAAADFGRLGPTGILVGIIVGICVSIVFHLYTKMKLFHDSSIPDFVVEWINTIIPTIANLGIWGLLTYTFQIDIFDSIIKIFEPIQSFGQTLPGLILLCFIPAFFYSMGISSWLFNAVQTPIFMVGIAANIAAAEAGLAATSIVTSETVYSIGLIMMGGTGATLTLNLLMLRSKAKKLKTLGRICIVPSIFNINEPIVFSTPIVMNPMLMLPMWINSIVGPIVVWIAMRQNLLKIPTKMIQLAQIPAPISSVIITEDWRAVIVYAILFVLYLTIWYPFYKVYENEVVEEEMKAAKEA